LCNGSGDAVLERLPRNHRYSCMISVEGPRTLWYEDS
jgi:hypothetical protein